MIYVCMNLFVMMEFKKIKNCCFGSLCRVLHSAKDPLPSAMVTALSKAGKMGARKTIFPALPSAVTMILGKDFFFKKNSNFAECRPEGTRRRNIFLKKIQTLPNADQGALGKEFLEKK